jgi:protein-tyrosine phosphatase
VAGYVDIHAHVLPGIDDGPRDLEGALALARAAVGAGTTTIAATPHLRSDFPDVHVTELASRCEEIRHALEREAIPLELVSGAEISLTWALDASADELRLASYGQRGTDLLIETPSSSVIGLDRLLYELRSGGYRITLAHPERNPQFPRQISLLESLLEQGVLLQVNADSLLGPGGRSGPRRFARHLCARGLAHVVASDGHRAARWRPVTELGDSAGAAARLVGSARAGWMMRGAPSAILAGRELPDVPPSAPTRGRWAGIFSRLGGSA